VVVELLNRFPVEVERQLRGELPAACLRELREVDNVRPLLVVPIWVDSVLRRTLRDGDPRIAKIKDIWDGLADSFLDLPFIRQRDLPFRVDSVDQLEWALKFSKGISFHTASQVVTWIKQKMGGDETTSHQNAFNEAAFIKKQARFVVHGHTHHREIVPLDSQLVGGQRLDQIYFNSGTWRRIHELARFRPTEQEFMGYHEMTYWLFSRAMSARAAPLRSGPAAWVLAMPDAAPSA
jgi:UDP-2,3-diacylglucosamine pyrophosphatase LpxH